ncbi:hypothetical protein WDY80_03555 [Gordonia hongkongensis]|uniref:hypothetical protein n=1 Tax=Gordonia hongkongensis TaxID=1701090 RepID=UPI0030D0B7EB
MGEGIHLLAAPHRVGHPQPVGHELHECPAACLAGEVAGLDLIDLPVTGHGQPGDRFLGVGRQIGQLGIGARRQVHGL